MARPDERHLSVCFHSYFACKFWLLRASLKSVFFAEGDSFNRQGHRPCNVGARVYYSEGVTLRRCGVTPSGYCAVTGAVTGAMPLPIDGIAFSEQKILFRLALRLLRDKQTAGQFTVTGDKSDLLALAQKILVELVAALEKLSKPAL